ncbi:YegP family protein [Arthrobacter sp. TMN-50]
MSGYFKIVDAHDGGYRIKLMAGDGALVAVSTYYPTKIEAVAGIEQMREVAGTGPVTDQSRGNHVGASAAGKKVLSNERL